MSRKGFVVLQSFLAASFILLTAPGSALAQIVAIGASGTSGTGVGAGQAYPEVLTRLLAEKGYNVRVANAGIHGDTTSGMLARLAPAVPPRARIRPRPL